MSEAKNTPKTAAAKHIMDVTRPGKSAPSTTSKPVIVTNRPVLKDPMVVDDSGPGGDDATEVKVTRVPGKIKIQPLTALTVKKVNDPELSGEEPATPEKKPALPGEEPALPAAAEAGSQPAGEKPSEEPLEEPAAEKKETPKPEPEPETPSAEDSTAAPAAESEDKPDAEKTAEDAETKDAQAAEEAAKHAAAIQTLADSKKYYLPVNTVEKRRTKRVVVLGIVLSILLALAWADIALDAGLIQISGVKPVTHFFSN